MELNVFLRQSRNYVQGTQMIARSAELLGESCWFFEQALFSTITDSPVVIAPADDGSDEDVIGRIVFSNATDEKIFRLKKSTGRIPRRDIPMPVKVEFVAEEPDAIHYRFEGATDFEGLLNVMVQSVKSEHERVFPSAQDIWLTGFRGFHLLVDIVLSQGKGFVRLRRGRVMGSNGAFQTLWGISLSDAKGEVATGTTTFAFKTMEAPIVD